MLTFLGTVAITGSPAELAPRLRSVLRAGQFPCPFCRTRQDLLTLRTTTWDCSCGTGFYYCPQSEQGDLVWEALLTRLSPLIPEDLRDAVLDLLEEEASPPTEFFTGLWTGFPFNTPLYAVSPQVAVLDLPALSPQAILKLASDRLGVRLEQEEPAPTTWQQEQDGWVLRWWFDPALTLTITGDPRSTGGWTKTPAAFLTWTAPLPSFAALDEAIRWLDTRFREALPEAFPASPPSAESLPEGPQSPSGPDRGL